MRTFLTVILALVCAFTFAQKKPSVNKAKSSMEKGELSEAKLIIDQAIEHEKTMGDAKTWYYRGMIYATLDTSMNEPGALETAVTSFNKALEIDPEQKSVNSLSPTGGITNVDSNLQGYYAYYYNVALANYSKEEFLLAADNFETAFYINPQDTNAILNAAYASVAGKDEARAKINFKKAYDGGNRDKTLFLQLYNFAIKAENFEEGLAIIQDARKSHPDDIEFSKYEINLLIKLEKIDDAKNEILAAIDKDPQNPDLYFSLGVLKEELEDKEGAVESYKDALEIDPNHYNSNFNLGALIFNDNIQLINERNGLGYRETVKIDALDKKIKKNMQDALPLWENIKATTAKDNPDLSRVLETLRTIYRELGMNDKALQMADELDAIKN